MAPSATPFGDLVALLLKEAKRRLVTLTALFSLIALAMLAVGIMIPKRYDCLTTLSVESGNIIKPLMEGRAFTAPVDRASVASEVLFSRKTLREVLAFGGWLDPPLSPREEDRAMTRLKTQIHIDSPREERLRIAYSDTDPERCLKIANKLSEIFLRESTGTKERESREAFEFIDKQVKEYGDKLASAHENVIAYYRGQDPTAAPETPGPAPAPRPRLRSEDLAALRAEEASLSIQLNRKSTAPSPQEQRQVEDQYRMRAAQLQSDLERLLATYTEQHPDVKRVSRELAAAKEELRRAETARKDHERAIAATSALDDEVAKAARARLEEVRRKIAAAGGGSRHPSPIRPTVARDTPDPELKGVGQDATLSELLRRYESTRDIYQDFLKRRETARVSMMLDSEHHGVGYRVQEAAELPVNPSGLRLMHFCLAGLLLALLIPLGLLFALVRLDPRVRSPEQIERLARVPLLVSIPFEAARRDQSRQRARLVVVGLMLAGVFAIYALAFVVKLKMSS